MQDKPKDVWPVTVMRKTAVWTGIGLLIIASVWYANTALVYPIADPLGPWLVVKPWHGIYPFYGGGEQITGVNPPPGPTPWWMKYDEFHTLKFSHYECSTAWWEDAYGAGYVVTMMSWILIAVFVFSRWYVVRVNREHDD